MQFSIYHQNLTASSAFLLIASKSVFILTYLTPISLARPTDGDSTSAPEKFSFEPLPLDDSGVACVDEEGEVEEEGGAIGRDRLVSGVSIEPG